MATSHPEYKTLQEQEALPATVWKVQRKLQQYMDLSATARRYENESVPLREKHVPWSKKGLFPDFIKVQIMVHLRVREPPKNAEVCEGAEALITDGGLNCLT